MKPQVVIAMPIYKYLDPSAFMSGLGPCLRHPSWIRNAIVKADTYIDAARNEITRTIVRDASATHVWWIDADMDVPPEALEILLSATKPVVGGWYCGRDGRPTAYDINEFNGDFGPGYQIEPLDFCEQGLQLVGGLPLGCTLIETKVLHDMREHFGDEKWFVREHELGEDVWFHLRLREMGIPAYLDNRVNCGHHVDFVMTREMWEKRREKQELAV